MKQIIHKTLGIAIIAFFSQAAMATDVTSTFTDGVTLTATQMTEIKDAVNSKQNINQSAGAAQTSIDNQFSLTTTETVFATLSINAPASGVIVVNTSGYFTSLSSGTYARCSISSTTGIDYAYLIIDGGATTNPLYKSFAATRAYTVTAAGAQTYNLVCDIGGGTSGNVGRPKLTAVFVPNSY